MFRVFGLGFVTNPGQMLLPDTTTGLTLSFRIEVCWRMYSKDLIITYNDPKGPRAQTNGVLGPKYYNINGMWALKPYDLGPWTLRERPHRSQAKRTSCEASSRDTFKLEALENLLNI